MKYYNYSEEALSAPEELVKAVIHQKRVLLQLQTYK